jgi:hypothetical protein
MGEEVMSLRERQRLMTQRTIQQHAMRLFLERGYDETTVNDVARAAGVFPPRKTSYSAMSTTR